jgi:hypothetical protein
MCAFLTEDTDYTENNALRGATPLADITTALRALIQFSCYLLMVLRRAIPLADDMTVLRDLIQLALLSAHGATNAYYLSAYVGAKVAG